MTITEHAAAPIRDVRVRRVVMPKDDPTWRFALGARAESVGILLEMEDADGLVGLGYASEVPHLGYDIDVMEAVVRSRVPAILAAPALDRRSLVGSPWKQELPAPVRSLLDMAWHDRLGKIASVPLYRLLGGAEQVSLRVNRILALKNPDEMAVVAAGLAAEGYDHFKIKVENRPSSLDIARVAAIRDAVGEKAVLTVDANQSYTAKEAVIFGHAVHKYGVQVFEQPVPRGDIAALRWVRERSDLTIEADESADSLESVVAMLRAEAVDAISLKLSKLGGLDSLLLAANLCAAHGVGSRIGAHVGSRIMNAAAVHAAAALPHIEPFAELGEFARLMNDVATGLEVVDGGIAVPTAPGLGVSLV
ncbi:mandelate racemase/muconate lactonizing enzyme family protein [Streptomyces sp. NPDC059909]|uniref:mandelate racemase/muconate lactonizing enzyme family protein n=1 Tax=Streptomyces sp. NPDC059909 TaxID=3346998 RepID=UPI0036668206